MTPVHTPKQVSADELLSDEALRLLSTDPWAADLDVVRLMAAELLTRRSGVKGLRENILRYADLHHKSLTEPTSKYELRGYDAIRCLAEIDATLSAPSHAGEDDGAVAWATEPSGLEVATIEHDEFSLIEISKGYSRKNSHHLTIHRLSEETGRRDDLSIELTASEARKVADALRPSPSVPPQGDRAAAAVVEEQYRHGETGLELEAALREIEALRKAVADETEACAATVTEYLAEVALANDEVRQTLDAIGLATNENSRRRDLLAVLSEDMSAVIRSRKPLTSSPTLEPSDAEVEHQQFRLEWDAAPRPPAHPTVMRGQQTFGTFEQAVNFMSRQPSDAVLVSITQLTTTKADRTNEASAALIAPRQPTSGGER